MTDPKDNLLLEEGDIITIKTGMSISVQVPEMFVYSNRRDSKALTTTTVKVGSILDNGNGETFNTKKFAGNYLVEKTTFEGGGQAHNDTFPDGHHVVATKLKKDNEYSATGTKIEFYQTGFFNCMIKPDDIQAEGKMQKSWVVVPTKDLKSKIGSMREDSDKPVVVKKMTNK